MSSRRDARILVVDDRAAMAETIADGLVDEGFQARAVASSREALKLIESNGVDLLVTDLRMPEVDGLALLTASRKANPDRPVIVMTAYGAIDSAVESIRQGAYHYLTKPFKNEELVLFVDRALSDLRLKHEAAELKKTLQGRFSRSGLLGNSAAMRQVLAVLERVAPSDAPVLLTGETGSGKGAVARALHGESARAHGPFVAINVAALPENLLESELFGHVKGAFTGASGDKAGLFVEASSGTLFLDEIGEMPLSLQAKLLHVLESNTVRPVGATKERQIDVRIVAATHRDLRQRVREGAFREDLLYRLDVVTVELPPLRQRREDIPLFLEHFLTEAKTKHATSKVEHFSRSALNRLLEYRWPGNIRELAHVVERSVLLSAGPEVQEADLPRTVLEPQTGQGGAAFSGEIVPVRELTRRYARWAYRELGEHRARTAEKLGIDVKTLSKYLSDEGDGE